MHKRHIINPRQLFGLSLIAPHVLAFNDDPDDGPTPTKAPAPQSQPSGGGEPNGGQNPAPQPQFNQDDINRIVAERAARAKASGQSEVLEALGFESLDQAREFRKQRETAEEQRLLEEKKYSELLEKREKELAEIRQQLDRERNKRVNETLSRTVLSAAAEANAVQPEQVSILLRDRFKLTDDGKVRVLDPATGEIATDGNGAELTPQAFVRQWLEQNPHHLRAAAGRGSNAGAPSGNATAGKGFDPRKRGDLAHLAENRDELIEKARRGEIKL